MSEVGEFALIFIVKNWQKMGLLSVDLTYRFKEAVKELSQFVRDIIAVLLIQML